MNLEPSALLGRFLRQDPPEQLGISTLIALEEAIEAGDIELAKSRMEYARKEWEIVHDMYVKWAWNFFTYIQHQQGDEGLERAYRALLGSYYRDRYDAVMSADPETQLQLAVEGLRGHLMGPGRRGEVPVTDEGKRWKISLEPCSSGGVATQRLYSGEEKNLELFGFSDGPQDWTWGKERVCHYCGHCAFVNEILAIENYGHPMRITEYSGDPDGSCTWYIYKDPRDIPAEYYERVGKPAPDHAPRLSAPAGSEG